MWGNIFKTALLLGVLTALLFWIGSLFEGGMIISIILVVLMNFGAFYWSDKMVLSMYRAQPAGSQHKELVSEVKALAKKAGLPMPKVYVIPSSQPNAFATGRGPNHAVVAFTEGILRMLNKDELRGVIAHELAHVRHRDILIATVAAMIAGSISMIGNMLQWMPFFGGGDREQGGNMLGLLVIGILSPLVAAVIQLAISRSREYHADAAAATYVGGSDGLVSALKKLDLGSKRIPLGTDNKTAASLFIVNPFAGQSFSELFSTHPPMAKRIRALQNSK